jgi:dynein heavy chain
MPKLEQIFDQIDDSSNKDFRLLITTAPFKLFPVNILQKGIKITYEPPKGIKNSLKRSYANIDPDYFESCKTP